MREMLNTACTHRYHVLDEHCFLYDERLSVSHAGQISIEAGNRAKPFPDLLLLGKQIAAFRDASVLRLITHECGHAAVKLARDIYDKRRRHIGINARVKNLVRPVRL